MKSLMFLFFTNHKPSKEKIAGELENQALRIDIDAAYAQSAIPEMEKIIAAKQERVKELWAKIGELENAHEYGKRKEREKLGEDIESEQKRIAEMQQNITKIRKNVETLKQNAGYLRHKAEFIHDNFR